MAESYDRFYHDQVDPITADKRNRVIPRSNIRRLVVPLDVAGNDQPYRLRGDFLYADNNTTGNVTCKLNNTSEDPFPLLAQAGLTDMPFEDIYLTWSAQAGKVFNLFYGYKARFASPSQNIATIGSITNPVKIQDTSGNSVNTVGDNGQYAIFQRYLAVIEGGFGYGAIFKSVGNFAAGPASELVLAAASNVNGIIVWDADIITSPTVAGNSLISLHAHTVAPTLYTDGDVLMSAGINLSTAAGIASDRASLNRARRIPAGKGLWFFNSGVTAEAIGRRKVMYTVL